MFKTVNNLRWQEQEDDLFLIYYQEDVLEANSVTIRILELCRNPKSAEEIVLVLQGEYDIDAQNLCLDVGFIVDSLVSLGLLTKEVV